MMTSNNKEIVGLVETKVKRTFLLGSTIDRVPLGILS